MKKIFVLLAVLLWAVSAWGLCPYPEPVGCPNTTINMDGNTVTGNVLWSNSAIQITGEAIFGGDVYGSLGLLEILGDVSTMSLAPVTNGNTFYSEIDIEEVLTLVLEWF